MGRRTPLSAGQRPPSGSNDPPYVIFGITVAGTMRLLQPTLDELAARGWRTKVVMSPEDPSPEVPDATYIDMPRSISPRRDAVALSHWIRLLRAERPDAVVGSTAKAATLAMTASRITGVRTRLFLVRGARWDGMTGWRGELLRRTDQVTAAAATDVVAVSGSLAELMVEAGIMRTPPRVLGSGGSKGVDTRTFVPREVPPGPPTIGFVGRLSIDKGIADLVEVFEHCRQHLPDTRLVLVGEVDDAQPIEADLQRRLHQPGIEWLGHSSTVQEILPSFDVLVFPSIREGLPNAVIEAAACGVPTVGYDTTGVRDAIVDGLTGALVPLGDVHALGEATLAILRSDGSQMRQAARDLAVSEFDQDVVVGAFVNHLESLLRPRR